MFAFWQRVISTTTRHVTVFVIVFPFAYHAMSSKISVVFCGMLLATMVVAQHYVTVSFPTCLPGFGPMSFVSPGGLGASTLPTGSGVMPNKS